MLVVKIGIVSFFLVVAGHISAHAEEAWPEKMVKEMECLKQHGLIQGSVADVLNGDAHFAPYYKPLAIGGNSASIRWNGQFIEGKTNLSPEIIKMCMPNATFYKIK